MPTNDSVGSLRKKYYVVRTILGTAPSDIEETYLGVWYLPMESECDQGARIFITHYPRTNLTWL